MNKTIILLMLLFNFELVKAQQYNFSNIGTNKGLPSSECYGLLQDSKGYIWVRTLNGLCKFNGKKFKVFTKKEGLKSNAIYALYEDKKQRMWFATSTSHVGYIRNDSIFYLPSSERFAKENGYGQKVFYQFVADEDFNIYVSSHERAYKFIEKESYKNYILLTQDDYFLKIIDINHQTFCIPDTVAKIRKLENRRFNISVFGKNINVNWDETTINQGIIRITYPCIDKDGSVFFQISNRLFCINKQGVQSEIKFESLIYHTFIDKENNLWIGLNSGGLLMYSNADLTRKPQHLLKDETISGINQDFEGGIWVSSLNKGLFYCKNLFNENLINSAYFNYKPEMLKIIDSSLFISDFKSSVVQLNIPNAKILSKKITVEQAQIGILDIDPIQEGYLLSGRNSLYRVDKQFNFLGREHWQKKLKLSAGAYNTIVTSSAEIIGISKNYITNYTKGYLYKLPSFGNDIIEFQNNITKFYGIIQS